MTKSHSSTMAEIARSSELSARTVTVHHPHHAWNVNLTHLEGVHGGRIKASPPASDVHWQLGGQPCCR